MDDLVDKLWIHFAEETRSHLSNLESLLADPAADTENINQLFRGMHSVKGLARAMDMRSMEDIAYGCENILGLIREGKAGLETSIVELLASAVTELKRLREIAVSQHENSAPEHDLLERIAREFVAMAGQVEEPEEKEPENRRKRKRRIHDDQGLLDFFASITKDYIPVLTNVLDPGYEGNGREADRISGALHGMQQASEGISFFRMMENVGRMEEVIPSSGPLDQDSKTKLVNLFIELKSMINHIETEGEVDAGSGDFSPVVESMVRDMLDEKFYETLVLLDHLEKQGQDAHMEEGNLLACERISVLAKSIKDCMGFVLPAPGSFVMPVLEDVYNRIGRGELPVNREFIGLSREAVTLEKSLAESPDPNKLSDSEETIKNLLERINENIFQFDHQHSVKIEESMARDLLSEVHIKQELRDVIAPENMKDLLEALGKGWNVFEITTHLESSEEVAVAFSDWAQNRAKVITNRTMIIDDESWFEFLVVTESPPEVVIKEISDIDPEGLLLQARQCPRAESSR